MLATGSPFPQFFDLGGEPLENGDLYFGVANLNPVTNPTPMFWDAAGTQPVAQPVATLGGYPVRNGTPALIYAPGDYSLLIRNSRGENVAYAPAASDFDVGLQVTALITALSANLANTANVALGDKLIGTHRTTSGAIATTVHDWIEGQQLDTLADFGIAADGVTDKTAALTALLAALGLALFRGFLHVPYATKFTIPTVYAATPVGIVLRDDSSINWNVGASKARYATMYSGDNAADDTQAMIASGHHPARFFMNFGTAGTSSATDRLMSTLYAIGQNYAGNPLTTLLVQHKKDPGGPKWMFSYRVQTPYDAAIKNPQNWVTATIYAAGAYCISDAGKVYTTVAGGTSGAVAPTGNGAGINDGGVLWNYKYPAINIDGTFREEDEQGNIRQYGVPQLASSVELRQSHNAREHGLDIDGTSKLARYRDFTRGFNLLTSSEANGWQLGDILGVRSLPWTALPLGATPVLPGSYCTVTNVGATTITNITLTAPQTQGYMRLLFANGNTTIQNGANFVLKGGVNVTPIAGQSIEFVKNTSISAAWVEMSRSF